MGNSQLSLSSLEIVIDDSWMVLQKPNGIESTCQKFTQVGPRCKKRSSIAFYRFYELGLRRTEELFGVLGHLIVALQFKISTVGADGMPVCVRGVLPPSSKLFGTVPIQSIAALL